MEKEFELYDRHDGRTSPYGSKELSLEEAAEEVNENESGITIEDATKKIEALEVGKEWRYYNGSYLERFVKRTK